MSSTNKTVNVLGTEYKIIYEDFKDDDTDGSCDYTSHVIKIRSDNTNEIGDFRDLQKQALRHELIHAFMAESGLRANWEHAQQFGHEETTVDWFAIQAPKIYKLFEELDIL